MAGHVGGRAPQVYAATCKTRAKMSHMRWTRSPAFIAVVVLVDVVVVALAYLMMRGEPDAEPTRSPPPTASADGSSLDKPPIEGPLYLASSPSGGLLRVTRGSCDSRFPVASRVWVASSFKAPLRQVKVPGLQESLGISMRTNNRLAIVGTGDSCKVSGFVSSDGGGSWRRTAVPKDIWYVDTDTTLAAIHGPVSGGVANLECTPASVTTLGAGDRAFVSCSDVNVVEVSSKKDVSPIVYVVTSPGGVAQPSRGKPLVLAATTTCGAAVVRITSQQDARRVACLGNDGAPLGLAGSGDRIFAQIGYELMVSTNNASSFTRYPGESGNSQ